MGEKAASQTSGPRKGRNEMQSVFLHGHVPGKKHFSPRECQLCWRGSGCIPQFWEPSAAGPKIPAFPSPPSWGAGRYGRGTHGPQARQKKERTPQGPPKLEKVGPGRKNLFLPGVLSSDFLQRKSGSPAGVGGAPRGAAPRGFETAPTTRRVRTTGDLAPGPTSGAAGRRSNPAEKKNPPLWSATRGRIPRRRATLSSCFLYVCPGKAGRLALCGGRGLTPAPA